MNFLIYSISLISGSLLWENLWWISLLPLTLLLYKFVKQRLVIIFFIVGFIQGLYFYYPYLKIESSYPNYKNQKFDIFGSVSNFENRKFILKVDKIRSREGELSLYFPFKVYVYLNDNITTLNEKDYIKVSSTLKIPEDENIGSFNFRDYLKSRGIQFVLYLNGGKELEVLKNSKSNNFILNYKNYINKVIVESDIPDSLKGFVIAITTGDRSFLSLKDKKFLLLNGLSHIFSISGFNVAIFFALILIFFRILTLKLNNFYLPYLLSFPLLLPYIFFMGGDFPIVRAGIAAIIVILSLFIKRYKTPFDTLFLIFLVIILISPYSFLNISFQFSFMVVFALIFFTRNSSIKSNILIFFLILIVSFIAGIPLSLYHFAVIYPKGILANIAAIPVFTFAIIPASTILIFLIYIKPIALILIKFSAYIMDILFKLLNIIPEIDPFFYRSLDLVEIILLSLVIFLIINILSRVDRLNKKILIKTFTALLFIVTTNFLYSNFQDIRPKVTLLNFGKSVAVLIKSRKNYLIYTNCNLNLFERKIHPFLLKNRVKDIDYLILPFILYNSSETLLKVSNSINIKNLVVNDKRILDNESFSYIKKFTAKENINIDELSIIYPPEDKFYLLTYRNSSIVLKFKDILITYSMTSDIVDYLKFKNKFNYKLLITYDRDSALPSANSKEIVLKDRDNFGYSNLIEIYPDKGDKIKVVRDKESFIFRCFRKIFNN